MLFQVFNESVPVLDKSLELLGLITPSGFHHLLHRLLSLDKWPFKDRGLDSVVFLVLL